MHGVGGVSAEPRGAPRPLLRRPSSVAPSLSLLSPFALFFLLLSAIPDRLLIPKYIVASSSLVFLIPPSLPHLPSLPGYLLAPCTNARPLPPPPSSQLGRPPLPPPLPSPFSKNISSKVTDWDVIGALLHRLKGAFLLLNKPHPLPSPSLLSSSSSPIPPAPHPVFNPRWGSAAF